MADDQTQNGDSGTPDRLPWHSSVEGPIASVIFMRTDGVWQADYGHQTVAEGEEFSDVVAAVEKWARDRRLVLCVQGLTIDLVRAPHIGSPEGGDP